MTIVRVTDFVGCGASRVWTQVQVRGRRFFFMLGATTVSTWHVCDEMPTSIGTADPCASPHLANALNLAGRDYKISYKNHISTLWLTNSASSVGAGELVIVCLEEGEDIESVV